jgi:prepilin-type N-terminal cleavage/methylation domain-containing protein
MKITNRNAFSLVELMVVISILGILTAIGLNSYLDSLERAKQAQLKSNMALLSLASTTYCLDNESYADNYFNLKKEAIEKKYWAKYLNPWTNLEDNGLDMNHKFSPMITDTLFSLVSLNSPNSSLNSQALPSELIAGNVIYCSGEKSEPLSLLSYAIYSSSKSIFSSSSRDIFRIENKVYYISNGR